MPDLPAESASASGALEAASAGVHVGANDGDEVATLNRNGTAAESPAWLFALAALVVCLAGAGRQVWSLGVAVMIMGGVIAFAPSVRRLPLLAAGSLGLVLVAPLAAFLPGDWLGVDAPWRRHLVQEWGILLANSVSPQPAVTFEAWLVIGCLVVWLWACLGQGFTEENRRIVIRALALGGSLLALLSMLEHWNVIEMPWWPRNAAWGIGFGPFSNRNHIASMCAISCVLSAAAAYDAYRKQSSLWILHAVTFLLPLACIFVNTSRSGLLLFFIGMTGWLATASLQRGFFKKLAVSASVLFVGVAAVMVVGGGLTKRLVAAEGIGVGVQDVRLALYRETLSMSANSPWLGIGLGNFESVFPMTTEMHEPAVRYLHPESDLMWLLAEGGLLTLVPLSVLVVWWLRNTGPWFAREGKGGGKGRLDKRLRKAVAIGGILALLHGLLDVPNHGVGYAMFTSVLLAAAVAPKGLNEPAARWQRWLFRGAGAAMIVLGGGWLANASTLAPKIPLASTAKTLHDRAIGISATGEFEAARSMVDRAIRLTPLDFRLYFLRAQLKLSLRRPSEEALVDFGRARTIEPHYAHFCFDEGVFWLGFDPQMAVIPWREYLRRYPGSAAGLHGYYRQMLAHALPFPELRRELWKLASTSALKLDYLEWSPPGDDWNLALADLLAQQPKLDAMDADERRRLFAAWQAKGDRDHLLAELERHPAWKPDSWRILAEEYGRRGRFQLAYETAAKFVPMPSRDLASTRVDIGELERAFVYSPADPRRGLELYYAQRSKGQLAAALVTLEKVTRLPNAPGFIRQEMAAIYALKQDYRRAWELLQSAMVAAVTSRLQPE